MALNKDNRAFEVLNIHDLRHHDHYFNIGDVVYFFYNDELREGAITGIQAEFKNSDEAYSYFYDGCCTYRILFSETLPTGALQWITASLEMDKVADNLPDLFSQMKSRADIT